MNEEIAEDVARKLTGKRTIAELELEIYGLQLRVTTLELQIANILNSYQAERMDQRIADSTLKILSQTGIHTGIQESWE